MRSTGWKIMSEGPQWQSMEASHSLAQFSSCLSAPPLPAMSHPGILLCPSQLPLSPETWSQEDSLNSLMSTCLGTCLHLLPHALLFSRVHSYALPLSNPDPIFKLSCIVLSQDEFPVMVARVPHPNVRNPGFTSAICVMLAQASISRIWMERKHYLQIP